jgi:hypothetical protein
MSRSVGQVLAIAARLRADLHNRGIDDEIIDATLADIDRQLALHHQHTGRRGFDVPGWLDVVLSGNFFQLGRLQFDLRGWRPDEPRPPGADTDWLLDVHIPATGPLDQASVSASFQQAAQFFPRHFPDRPARFVVCESWLLDPFLAAHLPPESNIVTFQRQFVPYGESRHDELDAMYFVFGRRSLDNLGDTPRRTALQRLVLDRIEAGGSWQVVHGYRRLNR